MVGVSRTLSPVRWVEPEEWDQERFNTYYPEGFAAEFLAAAAMAGSRTLVILSFIFELPFLCLLYTLERDYSAVRDVRTP